VPGLLLFYEGTKSWISPLWFRTLQLSVYLCKPELSCG